MHSFSVDVMLIVKSLNRLVIDRAYVRHKAKLLGLNSNLNWTYIHITSSMPVIIIILKNYKRIESQLFKRFITIPDLILLVNFSLNV